MPTKTKKIVKKKKITESSKKDKMMVLLEDVRDGIRLVAEGHSILERKMEEGHFALERKMEEGFNLINIRMDNFEKETKNNFKLVMENLSNIEDEILGVKNEIKALRQSLENKADLERLDALDQRVRILEQRQLVLRDAAKKKYKA